MITLSCSQCHGTIAKDLIIEADSPVSVRVVLAMKCPHCKNPQRVEVETRVEILRAIKINGVLQRDGKGMPHEDTIRTL